MDQLAQLFHQTHANNTIALTSYMMIIALSVVSSYILAFIYGDATKRRVVGGMGINNIFPLFAASVTTLFCLLQFSLPLSLGLLGSLSIVRFRTPVKDPIDTAFILVIIANCLLASLSMFIPMVVYLVVVAMIMQVIKHPLRSKSLLSGASQSQIIITIPSDEYHKSEVQILADLKGRLPMADVKSISHNDELYHLNLAGKVDPEVNISVIREMLPAKSTVNMFFDEFIAR